MKFSETIAKMKGEHTLLLCHDQADSDAIGAAYALARYIGGDVGVPQAVATHTHRLIEELELPVVIAPDTTSYLHVVVVDAASPVQLRESMPERFWFVDHHPQNDLQQLALGGLYDPVSSTCQLVYRLLKELDAPLDRKTGLALAAGIMTDTINFHKGDAEAFRTFGEILDTCGLTHEEIQSLYMADERRDRGAICQAAIQAERHEMDGYHVMVTEIGSNIPTFAARALFDLGADVSVVGYARGEEVEIRMYIRQELSIKHKLDAAAVFRTVDGMDQGIVWGYSLFAGYRAKGDLKILLQNIVKAFEKRLRS
ncbi:DHH family phosphoesterase [Tumebacillus permanentifrigoris]|uniref:NanoRNase/pAp phosphatase (C-di-AMP/oligoRNAs hydrolase) n=1 Tax=Tumebacillus permanentifrigoris TaxID=378543 RepID=A0A316D5I1_9BACL|nr:DHH family phosphoesterase [Tumebacillus permanentifrigoris]PWK07916.1 nanoRNase/pAp phosphatase (c-di-AMP/oligoRNAs hydrolase) [Tumebacillus permanentifrigoris]